MSNSLLDRWQKKMIQALDLDRVPSAIGILIQVLMGILTAQMSD